MEEIKKNKIGKSQSYFKLKIKPSLKLSLGEYGRLRPSPKFQDLVLNLKFQNSRVLETRVSSTFLTAESFRFALMIQINRSCF